MQIRRKKRRQVPGLNMASMPDLIFTVLFFFMIVTHMRNETVQVKLEVPEGTEVTKVAKKYSTMNIYVGKDKNNIVRIQVIDKICDISQVKPIVMRYKNTLSSEERDNMTVNLRVDRSVSMGIVNDIKQELRRAGVVTIRYSATEEKSEKTSE